MSSNRLGTTKDELVFLALGFVIECAFLVTVLLTLFPTPSDPFVVCSGLACTLNVSYSLRYVALVITGVFMVVTVISLVRSGVGLVRERRREVREAGRRAPEAFDESAEA